MVSSLNDSNDPPRASFSQREPQRGLEALSNFYGRFSTDHAPVRSKNTETSLSSYAGSMRRSSSGTEFYSNAQSFNGGDDTSSAPDPSAPQPKSPRVYTSFSAAAAAASRSSLNERSSQASFPNNANASPSIRNSPALSSPRTASSGFADVAATSGGGTASGLVSIPTPAQAKGASFDIAAINQYSPGSLANTFPWLSSNPDAPPKRDRVPHASNSKPLSPQTKADSPPISQYSKGKGFGWNPNKDQATPKSSSKIRSGSGGSQVNSVGRGLGIKSTSELDLPERMRSQRKGAPAPPRLSQDPISLSIEEELKPRSSTSKGDSAFSRFGRAFRRKSKTGSDLKADFSTTARDAPPLPKTPRTASSQALPVKPSDPFAEKALKASSGFVDPALRKPSSSTDVVGQARDLTGVKPTEQTQTSSDMVSGDATSIASGVKPRNGEQTIVPDEPRSTVAASLPVESQQSSAATQEVQGSQANNVENKMHLESTVSDKAQLTTDSSMASVSRDASMTSLQPEQDSSKRPTSMISSTSSANRSSLAFLAPAISMGAIASEIQGSSAEPLDASKDDTAEAVAPAQTNSDATTSPEPSSVSTPLAAPVVTPDADPNSLVHRQPASTEQTASSSSTAIPRKLSGNRSRLEPKSATRNDHIPGILSEFLSMDAELSAREAKLAKGKTPSRSTQDDRSAADISTDSSSAAMERSISCTSEGRRSSLSSSPKAVRATKGVYMAPAAGPHMGGFVSPFYVAPITSADSGIMARATRPSGRRASASSRSIHSDDSRSIYSASRRGSVPLAAPEVAAKDEQHQPASVSRVTDDHPDQQPREIDETEKARKIKSFGNLRTAAKDGPPEALPRASTSRLPSPSILLSAGEGRSNGLPTNSPPKSSEPSAATKDLPNALPPHEDSPSRSRSVSNRFVRRPKTSAADLAGERAVATLAHAEGHPRSGPGRASLDSGRSPVPYSSSPTETNFEMLAPRDPLATPTKSRDESLRQRTNLTVEGARPSGLERKSSSSFARRPSEQSVGAITPSSSKIESQGGAGGLFGNPSTRPRTSSLLPSFGFSRGRTGSSAGLEGTGKSPGSFSSSVRTASSGFRRDANESTATQEANGGGQSPRVSSSSRPSFSRQLSTSTGLSDAEAKQLSSKPEKKFSLSAFLPYDDEEAPEYAERIASTAPKAQIAAILASSADVFYVEALHHFMTRFWFNGLPLDIALRKLLMDLHLPKETQQIDRVMEAFAKRYNECNSGLFASDDQPYILSFSLMMLHTDAFNKNAKNKMTKVDYLRNTGASGVPTEILEYLYDNLTFTQFIYVEDEEDGKRRPSEASGMSLSGTSMSTSLGAQSAAASNSRTKLDPYYLITQGRLGELRPDLEDVIPEDTPFSYTGSLPTFDVDRLNSAFLHAPSIEIVTTKTPSEQPGTATPNPLDVEEDVVSLKVTKVGVVNRKDDVSDGGKKAASRKWKTSGLLLTGSQLLLFKDIIWINALQSQILDQVGHSLLCNGIPTDDDAANDIVEGGVIISPRITYFRPDGVISLADAVAVKDHTYGKYDFVFRLLAAKGRQYLVQAQSEDDMNDWIHKINFCASFRTSNIKIRGLDLAPRVGSGADGMERLDAPEDRLGRPDLSRPSFSGSTRRLNADDSGRTTPTADDSGDLSREGTLRLSVDPQSRSSESDVAARPRSSASHRLSPASSAIQKRAKARREMMLTKIAETEVQMERVKARLADEIRLARHFAILTPFLKSTRDRIEMSALPLASRIRALRLEVAKAESRCRILRLDLAAGERVARALLPNTYLSSSAMRAANRVPSAQMGTPQLMELGHVNDSQTQFEELFAPMGPGSNGSSSAYEPASVPASLSGTVNKPASHQRNQMNLNAVSEQPAEESPVLASRRQMSGPDGDDTEEERVREANARLAQKSAAKHAVGGQHTTRGSAADEVPEDWDLSQLARPGTNRISLVDLPSPNELEEATGGRFRFDHRPAEYFE